MHIKMCSCMHTSYAHFQHIQTDTDVVKQNAASHDSASHRHHDDGHHHHKHDHQGDIANSVIDSDSSRPLLSHQRQIELAAPGQVGTRSAVPFTVAILFMAAIACAGFYVMFCCEPAA